MAPSHPMSGINRRFATKYAGEDFDSRLGLLIAEARANGEGDEAILEGLDHYATLLAEKQDRELTPLASPQT